jgi:glycosyltransferase involved in cell wall biosynthesis
MIGEVLDRANRVIVHSEYARRKIHAVHGAAAEGKIDVIPHFAKPSPYVMAGEARRRLGIADHETIVLTSGFATRSKRFDWLIEALVALRAAGRDFRWIHAGQEREDEYPLTARIASAGLADLAEVTGYVSEDDLDAYIAAADIVVNLRFPSVGESSGTLARAFSAGRCCVVNDTAAYTEIPRDVAVHIPVFDTVASLTKALGGLLADRELRETFGWRARTFARTTLALDGVASRYVEAILRGTSEAAPRRPPVIASPGEAPVSLALEVPRGGRNLGTLVEPGLGAFDLMLWFDSAEDMADAVLDRPDLIASALGPHVDVRGIRVVRKSAQGRKAAGRIGLNVHGRSHG